MDIRYSSNGDIDLSTGDLQYVADPAEQHKLTVLMAKKGELKFVPDVGADAPSFLLDDTFTSLLRVARMEVRKIGIKVRSVFFKDEKIVIEGGYE